MYPMYFKKYIITIIITLLSIVTYSQTDTTKKTEQDTLKSFISVEDNKFVHVDSIQEVYVPDSLQKPQRSPVVGSLLSMAIPGAGQVYNKKYWKVPIIYGIFGGLIYWARSSNHAYQLLKYDYAIMQRTISTGEEPNTTEGIEIVVPDRIYPNLEAEELTYYMQQYRRRRDLSYILIGITYIMNIFDASVDAHLQDYDVDEDLSFSIKPELINTDQIQPAVGIRFALRF